MSHCNRKNTARPQPSGDLLHQRAACDLQRCWWQRGPDRCLQQPQQGTSRVSRGHQRAPCTPSTGCWKRWQWGQHRWDLQTPVCKCPGPVSIKPWLHKRSSAVTLVLLVPTRASKAVGTGKPLLPGCFLAPSAEGWERPSGNRALPGIASAAQHFPAPVINCCS